MKLEIQAKNLIDAISWVSRTYDAKDSQAHIDLTVKKDGTAFLSHANLTSFTKTPMIVDSIDGLENKDEVTLSLSGQSLTKIGSSIEPKGTVKLSKNFKKPGSPLEVRSSLGKFTVPTFGSSISTIPDYTVVGHVDGQEFFDALKRLSTLCDSAGAALTPVIATVDVQLDAESKEIVLMATDRFALGEFKVSFVPNVDEKEIFDELEHVLIPQDSASKVKENNPGEQVALIRESSAASNSGSKFGFLFDDGKQVLFSLIDAAPIAYGQLKDIVLQQVDKSVVVNSAELKKAINIISNLAFNETTISLHISANSIRVSDAAETNQLTIPVENPVVDNEDEETTVFFERAVINKVFNTVVSSEMRIFWGSETKPFILRSTREVKENNVVEKVDIDNIFALANPRTDA